jgi:hypothetical protein
MLVCADGVTLPENLPVRRGLKTKGDFDCLICVCLYACSLP